MTGAAGFPTPSLIDFWCEATGAEAIDAAPCGVPLVARGRTLVNAGERDFPLFDPAGAGPDPSGATVPPEIGQRADLLAVFDVPDSSPLRERLESAFPRGRYVTSYPCPIADMEGGFEAYFERRFSASRRRRLRRMMRKLEALGRVRLESAGAADADRAFPRFYRLLEERSVVGRSLDRNLERRAYLEELWRRFAGGPLRVSVLTLDGVEISFRLGFLSGDSFLGYMPVSDSAFARFWLGHLHLMLLLRQLADEGIRRYDFSKGSALHKEIWATGGYSLGNFFAPLGRGGQWRWRWAVARYDLRGRLYDPARLRRLRRLRFALARLTRPRIRRLARRYSPSSSPRARPAPHERRPDEPFSYSTIRDLPPALRRGILDRAWSLARAGGLRLAAANGEVLLAAEGSEEVWRWRCARR